MDVFLFDIWYPPLIDGVDQVKLLSQDILGNATQSFISLFKNTSDLLYPLVQAYDLDFCDNPKPHVEMMNASSKYTTIPEAKNE